MTNQERPKFKSLLCHELIRWPLASHPLSPQIWGGGGENNSDLPCRTFMKTDKKITYVKQCEILKEFKRCFVSTSSTFKVAVPVSRELNNNTFLVMNYRCRSLIY